MKHFIGTDICLALAVCDGLTFTWTGRLTDFAMAAVYAAWWVALRCAESDDPPRAL